ncbi:MAG TPA: response regulator [Lacunisphaera sp.]|jgi:CheY-like chemotaxis protein
MHQPLPASVQSSCDILVVDDDATLRSVLKTFLQRYGYVVQCAKDGRAALKILDQMRTHLVITDLFMPECDGFELIMQLRRNTPDLEILAISGDGLSDLDVFMGAVRQLGVRFTLKKPFELTELASLVKQAIGEAV